MSEPAASERSAGGYVVLREVTPGCWEVVGEVDRKPGLTARVARQQAVSDATAGTASPAGQYAAVLRSEWRIAQRL